MNQGAAATPRAGRRARALVLRSDGSVLGCLPAIALAQPWWQETDDLLSVLRQQFSLDAVVLRLLSASSSQFEPGAEVTYAVEGLGELPPELPLEPCTEVPLGDDMDPLRMPWARPGGVTADIEWADRELATIGRRRISPAVQVRTWNLSLLMRLTTDQGIVWLKHVPRFMRHEGAILELVREEGGDVPAILAAAPLQGLVLLDNVAGKDMYSADEDQAIRMVESLVTLQLRMIKRRGAITAAGGPDWGASALLQRVSRLAAREDVRADLDPTDRRALDELVSNLPAMLAALYACGLEDTLVHGDFFPGNHRFDGHRLVLLDWGDSGIGHPLLDMAAFLDRTPIEQVDGVREAWKKAWKDAHPNANVSLAADLIRPVGALRQAVIYRQFLDGIEASERVYHRTDVPKWLKRAIALTAAL
jgi:tRNA A-37 threonylcarbamoyl transferase component Bud32